MEYDLHTKVKAEQALNHQEITSNTTTVGEIIDTLDFESIEFILQSATVTDGVYTVKLEDGDDAALADAADVSSELVLGTLPDLILSDDNVVRRVGTIAKKRYVRLSVVSTGITSGGFMGAVAILSHPKSGPVADQST
jgi:hypothetical protein